MQIKGSAALFDAVVPQHNVAEAIHPAAIAACGLNGGPDSGRRSRNPVVLNPDMTGVESFPPLEQSAYVDADPVEIVDAVVLYYFLDHRKPVMSFFQDPSPYVPGEYAISMQIIYTFTKGNSRKKGYEGDFCLRLTIMWLGKTIP